MRVGNTRIFLMKSKLTQSRRAVGCGPGVERVQGEPHISWSLCSDRHRVQWSSGVRGAVMSRGPSLLPEQPLAWLVPCPPPAPGNRGPLAQIQATPKRAEQRRPRNTSPSKHLLTCPPSEQTPGRSPEDPRPELQPLSHSPCDALWNNRPSLKGTHKVLPGKITLHLGDWGRWGPSCCPPSGAPMACGGRGHRGTAGGRPRSFPTLTLTRPHRAPAWDSSP